MGHNVEYTEPDSNRHIDHRGHSGTCLPLSRQNPLLQPRSTMAGFLSFQEFASYPLNPR